MLFVTTKKMLA